MTTMDGDMTKWVRERCLLALPGAVVPSPGAWAVHCWRPDSGQLDVNWSGLKSRLHTRAALNQSGINLLFAYQAQGSSSMASGGRRRRYPHPHPQALSVDPPASCVWCMNVNAGTINRLIPAREPRAKQPPDINPCFDFHPTNRTQQHHLFGTHCF